MSVTTTSKINVPGPCASVGVQLNRPVVGSMVAPVGAGPARLNVRVCPASTSVAAAVKVTSASSFTVRFPIAPSTGASFTAVTVRMTFAIALLLPATSVTRYVKLSGPK